MSEEFTMAPQTSVAAAVKDEKSQLDRIETKLDRVLKFVEELERALAK